MVLPFLGKKKTNLSYFWISWPRNFLDFINQLAIFKIKHFSFLKTEFGIFQLQAPGNPD